MMRVVAVAGIKTVLVALCLTTTVQADMGSRPEVREFIAEMVGQHQFDEHELQALFAGLGSNDRIIKLISKPAEKKPWHQYRPIFINWSRISGGSSFMRNHAAILRRAEQQYGVPQSIITSIIGVETRYGGNTGSFGVVRALATLAFDYPPRAAFFRSELQHLLLLAREQGIAAADLKGSYAGAMGLPQFIASSYRNYAVDFDGDGNTDIWTNFVDAIGSVANYLQRNGWQRDAMVAQRLDIDAGLYQQLTLGQPKQKVAAADLAAHGISLPADVAAARIVKLDGADGDEYWLALPNFDCITTYNRSDLYAMAVFQLSREVAK